MKFVNRIAEKYNGLDSGSAPGMYGYFLTFAICYIRDFCLDHDGGIPRDNLLLG